MLLSIAGVDEGTIMENYLATNDYTRQRVEATLAMMPPAMAAIYEPLLGVDASYLQAGLDEISREYGSVDNYLKQGLGLSQETLYVLRGKMVQYGTSCRDKANCRGMRRRALRCLTPCKTASYRAATPTITIICNLLLMPEPSAA
ncbi:tyrosine-protein phosphatase [Klebsiella michiganensis]|nr:tyrosine-protein phosphatase [Klebsiella michiganensis]